MDSSSQKIFQTIKDSFEKIPVVSKRKPSLCETDWGKEFHNSIFQNFLKSVTLISILEKSKYELFFAERFNESIRNLLKKPVLERGDGNWIDVLPTIANQHNNRIHSFTELSPIKAPLKKNEVYVYQKLKSKRKKIKSKNKIHALVRTADLKTFWKGDTTNWSCKLYRITEFIKDTIPCYRIVSLPERYNETLELEKARINNEKTKMLWKP